MLFYFLTFWITAQNTAENYYTYKTDDFFNLAEVNMAIDLNHLDYELLQAAVFHASNQVRAQKNKPLYSNHVSLTTAARLHSLFLAEHKKFDHINRRDKELRTPMQRITLAGGDFSSTAENLAKVNVYELGKNREYFINAKGNLVKENGTPLPTHTYKSLALHVVDGWMHSKGHRENLMAHFNYLGCGVSDITFTPNKLAEIIITQNFGNQ